MNIVRKTKPDGPPSGPKPVHRKSRFIEHFPEDARKQVPRKSRFTEHFDISMTDEDIQAIGTAAPFQSAYQEQSKPAEARPTNHSDPASKSAPARPPSRSTVQTGYPSPMSVYSRASTDSKPMGDSRDYSQSRSPGQLKAFFVFQNGEDICDTRHLFGDAAVDAKTLVDTMEVLTGKGSPKMVRDIKRVRSDLIGSCQVKAADTDAGNYSVWDGNIKACWKDSQKTWRKHANAILEEERVAIINGYIEDPAMGLAESATVEKKHRNRSNGIERETSESSVDFWDEVEAPETEPSVVESGIDEQDWRGRSPTIKHVTAVRGCKSG